MTLREEGFFMEYKISNDLGLITISEDVLLKVAGYAALECYGIVPCPVSAPRTALWSGSARRI